MIRLIALITALALPAAADEGPFSEGSTAKNNWNLGSAEKAFFPAKVVDILCELSGDCPSDCGAGGRQLGLLREPDNALVIVNKNSQAAFSGAVQELLPYCGEMVEVDGLLVGDTDLTPTKVFLVQKIRAKGAEEWVKGNKWTKVWAADHPEAKGKGPWFRRDPSVLKEIRSEGYLGLGLDADETFKKEWFE